MAQPLFTSIDSMVLVKAVEGVVKPRKQQGSLTEEKLVATKLRFPYPS